MKNFKLFLILYICILSTGIVQAHKYGEEDKTMFYNAFIDGYITEMQKSVDKLDVEQEKKDKFMYLLKENIDKKFLIKSSWKCIQKFPIEQIVPASILCTSEWNKKQSEKNKDLFEVLK